MNYTISLWLPSGSERYNESGSNPAEEHAGELAESAQSLASTMMEAIGIEWI